MVLQNKEDIIIELLHEISSKLDILINKKQEYVGPTVYGPIDYPIKDWKVT